MSLLLFYKTEAAATQALTQTARFDNQPRFFTHEIAVTPRLGGRGRTRRRSSDFLLPSAYAPTPTDTTRPEPGGSPAPVGPIGVIASLGGPRPAFKASPLRASLVTGLAPVQARQIARASRDAIALDGRELKALQRALDVYTRKQARAEQRKRDEEDDEELLLLVA